MTIRRNDVPGVVDSFWDGFFQPILTVYSYSRLQKVGLLRKEGFYLNK